MYTLKIKALSLSLFQGYLKQAYKRPDMFNDKLLAIIFSNVEKIYHFHVEFLRCIEQQYHQTLKDVSCVGKVGAVFVQNVSAWFSQPFSIKFINQIACGLCIRYNFNCDGTNCSPLPPLKKAELPLKRFMTLAKPGHDPRQCASERSSPSWKRVKWSLFRGRLMALKRALLSNHDVVIWIAIVSTLDALWCRHGTYMLPITLRIPS